MIAAGLQARNYSPEDVKNPNIENRSYYVADPAGLVEDEVKSQVDKTLWNLRQKTGAEVVAVVVPNTGDYTREEFATKLFDDWKVGKSDKDNGVIILIVPDQREAWIATGYGVEGIIPDIAASQIVNRSVVPYMKNGDLNGALLAVTSDVANVLSNPEAAAELKSNNKEAWEMNEEGDLEPQDIINFIVITVILVAIVSFILFYFDNRRNKKRDRYNSARAWEKDLDIYLWLGILSLGVGILPYFLAKKKYRKLRNDPMTCPACKGTMRKLNEEEDNALLSPQQDMEERLQSVDYDVWVCDRCGSVEKYAFPNRHSPYQECPHCKTRAMTEVRNHTLVPATTLHSGVGERIFECKYCKNQTKQRYTIPKRGDAAAAAAAAGALSRGSGGFGGGGFGGGFGGGRTGGGGGGGRW